MFADTLRPPNPEGNQAMSRIGKKPVEVPSGVTVNVQDGFIATKGPLGELRQKLDPGVQVALSEDRKAVTVSRRSDDKGDRAMHGLYRALIQNMMVGVTQGYKRGLRIVGTGYRVEFKGGDRVLHLACGFGHPVEYAIPAGAKIEIMKQTSRESMDFVVTSCSKQQAGEVAAQIRRIRPPDLYQGKGIRYADERVRQLEGKSFGAGGK